MMNPFFILFVWAMGLSLLSIYFFFIEGQFVLGVMLALGALGLSLPVPVPGMPTIKPIGCMAFLCYAYATFVSFLGLFAYGAVNTPPYTVFDDDIGSGWSTREAGDLHQTSELVTTDENLVCKGKTAIQIPRGSSVQSLSFYRHLVPINRHRFPLEYIQFDLDSATAKSTGIKIAVQTDSKSFSPEDGLPIDKWTLANDGDVGCVTVKIPVEEFRMGNADFRGIQFRIDLPSKVIMDEIRLLSE